MCVLWQYCKVLVAVDGCPMHKLADECTSVLCYNSKSIQKSIFVILMQIVCKFSLKTVILGFDWFFFLLISSTFALFCAIKRRKIIAKKEDENRFYFYKIEDGS